MRRTAGRGWCGRTLLAGAALALLTGVSGCGTGTGTATAGTEAAPSGTPADATTRRIAEVEFLRQCTIDSMSFVEEAGITTDLDDRLAAAGFTHQRWKEWHDALADSPALVEQFAEFSAAGCPAG
ncbi:hypothetical protein [Modestobacter sp. VKM Ac-2985]|uniref:hypothetical protein n=1 Tax=Modestobacter sp. VKM Ac-2985 TaxID=3004139 RepID=UPI0022AB9554|nr:hypothetical protein [Modestobacter sp. VKM Ac-2985]MCZ2835901.1 hypothetical protein [Modestobacter sp. VKM Ac-2985]